MQEVLRRLIPFALRQQRLQVRPGIAAEQLAKAFSAQQRGDTSLLLAFRHPSPRDPLVLADLFWNRVPGQRNDFGCRCQDRWNSVISTTGAFHCGRDQ